MKILGTGLNGLVGSRVVELLSPKYEFESVSRSTGVDIQDPGSIRSAIETSNADVVLHLAAKTNVDGCEEDRNIDTEFQSGRVSEQEIIQKQTAWATNVLGTENVVSACREFGKKLIYISTDFVFDGKKEGMYSETDVPHPICWYGETKYEGEKIAQSLEGSLIVRIAYPYRADFEKKDFVRAIKDRLQNNQEVRAVEDHYFSPTFIDDIASCCDVLIHHNTAGIYHVVGSQTLTPYDAALLIADKFGLDKSLISPTTRAEYFKGAAPRPFNLSLKNDRIKSLNVSMKTFEEGLEEVKRQNSKVKN